MNKLTCVKFVLNAYVAFAVIEKHDMSFYSCYKEECIGRLDFCPNQPKYIGWSGLYKANHESCLLKPIYWKGKDAIIKPKGAEVVHIWGQQKAIKKRISRDNRL